MRPSPFEARTPSPHNSRRRSILRVEESPLAASLSNARASSVITTLTGISLVSSMGTGLLTVGIARMVEDLGLAGELLLW